MQRQKIVFHKVKNMWNSQSCQCYKITELIGSGSNGAVFKCTTPITNLHNNTKTEIYVALKFILNDGVTTSKIRNVFLNEYNILLHLPYHDNIQILSHFVDAPSDELLVEFMKKEPGVPREILFKQDPPLFKEIRM